MSDAGMGEEVINKIVVSPTVMKPVSLGVYGASHARAWRKPREHGSLGPNHGNAVALVHIKHEPHNLFNRNGHRHCNLLRRVL